MTTTNSAPKSPRRPLAILALPKNVSALLTRAQNIVQAMTNNPSFLSPTPPLASVIEAIQELQAAQTAALSRTKGAAATRNQRRIVLVKLLEQLKNQVQTVADASPESAASVIQRAGMAVKTTGVRSARVFAARAGAVSGSVNLVTHAAARRASYEWQSSGDGGKNWVGAPSTLQAKTTLAGLTPGAMVMFRYRPVTRFGEGDWSQPTSLIVK